MSRTVSRTRRREDADVAEKLFWLILVAGYPVYMKVRDWLGANPWALPFAITITAAFTLGVLAFAITLHRMAAEQKRRRLVTTQQWMDLSPSQFEQYVAELFRAQGFKTKVTGRTGDGGIDIVMARGDEKAVVQCKRYAEHNKVGVKDIREFSAVVARNKATIGYFVTTSSFTNAAFQWGRREPLTMINGKRLNEMAKEARFGVYAEPAPRPPLYFNAWQWLTLTLLGSSLLALAAFVATWLGR